jgi:hypothetical protein
MVVHLKFWVFVGLAVHGCNHAFQGTLHFWCAKSLTGTLHPEGPNWLSGPTLQLPGTVPGHDHGET